MDEKNYILFEAYLSQELSKDETLDFEERLSTDPEFKQTFNTYKELSSFLEHKIGNEEKSNAFQKNLKKVSEAHFASTEKTSNPKKTIKVYPLMKYLVAASVAVLFGVFTFNQFSMPTYEDYATYDNVSFTVRGENNTLLKTAENAFNAKDFPAAEKAFKQLIAADENNTELKLYRAITNIELNNFELADAILNNLKEGHSVYKNKALWYLALSKLKQEDYNNALEVLKSIPEHAEDYNQAQKLIKKID